MAELEYVIREDKRGFTIEERRLHKEILRLAKRFCALRNGRGARVPKILVQLLKGEGLKVEIRQFERRQAEEKKKEAEMVNGFAQMDISERPPA